MDKTPYRAVGSRHQRPIAVCRNLHTHRLEYHDKIGTVNDFAGGCEYFCKNVATEAAPRVSPALNIW